MAGRHGHKSATAVADGPTGPRHVPHGSSTTVDDLVPVPRGAAPRTSPPTAPERSRRWPWVVLGLLLAAAIGVTLFDAPGSGSDPAPPAATAPAAPAASPAPAPTAAPAGAVALPKVGGRNAKAAVAELRRLGLTDVRMVTDDDRTVDDPGKWTAVGLQPKPGTAVTPDRPVVLTVSQQD